MEDQQHALILRDEIVTLDVQHDLWTSWASRRQRGAAHEPSASGVSENGRGPQKNDAAYDARMAQLLSRGRAEREGGDIKRGRNSLASIVGASGRGRWNACAAFSP